MKYKGDKCNKDNFSNESNENVHLTRFWILKLLEANTFSIQKVSVELSHRKVYAKISNFLNTKR